MASLRDLRRRIKSVDGIRQITRAMEMVSATKLRRAQQRIESARPYTEKMDEILSRLSKAILAGSVCHPLMEPRDEVEKVTILAVASSKGLCGSFNANIIRRVEQYASELIDNEKIDFNNITVFAIGKKAFDYFFRRGWNIHKKCIDYIHIDENLPVSMLQDLTDTLANDFLNGETDRVNMIYTEFKSAIVHRIIQRQFLPIVGLSSDPEDTGTGAEYIFEPTPETLFRILIPKYARIDIFRMLADSLASEHGGRMTAMRNATDNAVEMIRALTLQRNKARQAAITKELAEIVGGAEALVG